MKWNSNGGEITAKNLIAFLVFVVKKCSPTVRKKFKKEKSKTIRTKIFENNLLEFYNTQNESKALLIGIFHKPIGNHDKLVHFSTIMRVYKA